MAQAECITTAIRELMSRGRPPKSTSPVRAAHTEFVAALAGNVPRPDPFRGHSEDLEGRADHLEKVFAALHVYLTAIIAETAQTFRRQPRSSLPRQCIPGLVGRRAGRNPQCCGGNARARDLEGLMTLPIATAPAYRKPCRPPVLYRRLRCPDHHGQRRGRPCPPLAGEAR